MLMSFSGSTILSPIVQSYRDLIVWKKSMSLMLDVYRSTHAFPKTETYGLALLLRRAAVSIPSNIAEGQARLSTTEFKQSLGHARGSLMEVRRASSFLAQELGYLGYLERDQSENLLAGSAEVGGILNGLRNSLEEALVTNHWLLPRKFSTSFFPASVNTLSGWNCTPSTA
jgi:four helix bundle protein